MQRLFVLAALTLVGTIYACGGGGGGTSSTTTSSGTSSSTIKLSGTAYDSAVESGTVTLYRVASDGSLTSVKSVSVSSNGSFSFSLSPGDLDNSTKYVIGVSGTIGGRDLKFFSPLGTGKEIKDKAGQGGTVTEEDIPELVVSNVSTAAFLILRSKYRNVHEIDPNKFDSVVAQLKATELKKRLELSAVIKAYLDKKAQPKSGISDFKTLVMKAWKYLKDDGELDMDELRHLFNSQEDIKKFALAKREIKEDQILRKVFYEGRADLTDQQLRTLVAGKTFYVKPNEYAPFYNKVHFNQNNTITVTTYYYSGAGWTQAPQSVAKKVEIPFRYWSVSNKKLYMWGRDKIKYRFIPLAVDEKAFHGMVVMDDDSQKDWLTGEIYDDNTYYSLNDFVNHFTNCQLGVLF